MSDGLESEQNRVSGGGSQKQLPWEALSVPDQIERMRLIIKMQQRDIVQIRNRMAWLENKIDWHSHGDGELLMPARYAQPTTYPAIDREANIGVQDWF